MRSSKNASNGAKGLDSHVSPGNKEQGYGLPEYKNPEIVIAFIGAIGSHIHQAEELLSALLKKYHYETEVIEISKTFHDFDNSYKNERDTKDIYKYYKKAMDKGDSICSKLKTKDALAQKSISEISRRRENKNQEHPKKRIAYIIHSLKRPEEIEALRAVYNELFFCIAIHAHYDKRLKRMIEKGMANNIEMTKGYAEESSKNLLQRDEYDRDTDTFGQNVRTAFEKADYYIGSDENGLLSEELERFLDLIFNASFIAPTIQETAMAHAYMAGLRSCDLSRQVGSAIVGRKGEIITTGCNEVPRPGGGQYRFGDPDDARDFIIEHDSNDKFKIKAIVQMVEKISQYMGVNVQVPNRDAPNHDNDCVYDALKSQMGNNGGSSFIIKKVKDKFQAIINGGNESVEILDPSVQASAERLFKASKDDNENFKLYSQLEPYLKGTLVESIIEFSRVTHAEMAAINEAAMRNVSVQDADLYCMTFPCHLCARHILHAGIRNVFYIEPYPKALTKELFSKGINTEPDMSNDYLHERLQEVLKPYTRVAFIPFSGVAPRRYGALFSNGRRKRENGDIQLIAHDEAQLRRKPIKSFHRNAEEEICKIIEMAQNYFQNSTRSDPQKQGHDMGGVQ